MSEHAALLLSAFLVPLVFAGAYIVGYWRGAKFALKKGLEAMQDVHIHHTEAGLNALNKLHTHHMENLQSHISHDCRN